MCDHLRVQLHSDVDDPEQVAAALVALAQQQGVADVVAKSLTPKQYTEMIIPELAMRQLLAGMRKRFGRQVGVLYRNTKRWLDWKHRGVVKATPPDYHLLTAFEIDELREVVRAHFAAGAMIGADLLALWENLHMEPADWGFMMTDLQTSFLLGRVAPDAAFNRSLADLRAEMAKRPRTRVDELALHHSEANMRLYLRKLGEAQADDVSRLVSAHEARQISGVVNAYMQGDLKQTLQGAEGLRELHPEERAALESDRWVESEQQLQRELFHYFKDDPLNRDRDWWRVAATETRAANNTGRLLTAQEEGYDQIWYLVQRDACKACREAYLEPDGTPRLFPVGELVTRAISTAGLNIGAGERGKPNAALHPHCNCIPRPYVPGTRLLRVA